MENIDKTILLNNLARRTGTLVSDILRNEELDEDVTVSVVVSCPSGYVDDKGEYHTGRLVTVEVAFLDDGGEDDEP